MLEGVGFFEPLSQEEVLEMFRSSGGYLHGHFELSSGLHSDTYLEKFRVLEKPEMTERLCREIARRFAGSGVEVVIGPVTGGLVLAYDVARNLGVRWMFAERESGRMVLRRGFGLSPGQKVLAVEDVITTGGSVGEVVSLVRASGADLAGVASLVDRSGGRVDFGARFEPLLRVDVKAWRPEECPLCKDGMPLQSRGSRKL